MLKIKAVARFYLFIYFFLLLCTAACTQRPRHTIIAFYNCENLFDTIHNPGKEDQEFTPTGKYYYTTTIYNEKLHHIAAVLARMVTDDVPNGPAIIGLAEIENDNVLKALTTQSAIARHHYHYIWYNGPDKRGINVALLYNQDAFTILYSEPLHVALNDTAEKATRDILYVKGILYGDTVHVLLNHWPSRLGGEEASEPNRIAAAIVCRQKIAPLLQHGDKVIVMGDFNENPTDTGIVCILKARQDSNGVSNNKLYNPWAVLYKSGEGTLMYQHQWFLFDQVMVSGAFLQHSSGYKLDHPEIFKPTFITDKRNINEKVPQRSFAGTYWLHGYSDHFPVILYLKDR